MAWLLSEVLFTGVFGWVVTSQFALRIFGFRISDRFGPFIPSRARSPINAKSLQSQGWECRKRPSGSGKLARSRYTQVGARSVHTPMAGWPAGALVPSSPKVRLGLDHRSAHAHDSPRPPSPAWLLGRDAPSAQESQERCPWGAASQEWVVTDQDLDFDNH